MGLVETGGFVVVGRGKGEIGERRRVAGLVYDGGVDCVVVETRERWSDRLSKGEMREIEKDWRRD